MCDYLELYKKFKDIKDVADYIDEVETLRYYYGTQQYSQMQKYINGLSRKYIVESAVWNAVNPYMPTTYEQSYLNAEAFMEMQGAKLVVKKVLDFENRLSKNEIDFIESKIKPVG